MLHPTRSLLATLVLALTPALAQNTAPTLTLDQPSVTLTVSTVPAGSLPFTTAESVPTNATADPGCDANGDARPFQVLVSHDGLVWPDGVDLQLQVIGALAISACSGTPGSAILATSVGFATVPVSLTGDTALTALSAVGAASFGVQYRLNLRVLPAPGTYTTTLTYTLMDN